MPDIVIADRLSDANQKLIPNVGNLQVSWEISKAGLLTCDATERELAVLGIDTAGLLAKWLHYTHPTAGAWSGQVTNVSGVGSGVATINAESWASCLRGATTNGIGAGSSGAVITANFQIGLWSASTGVFRTLGSVEGGFTMDAEAYALGQDIYESFLPAAVARLEETEDRLDADFRGPAYNVDPTTRVFSMSRAYGVDRSATVSLNDGQHNVSSEWGDDLTDVVNRVLLQARNVISVQAGFTTITTGKGKKKKKKRVPRFVPRTVEDTKIGVNQASIDRHGPRSLLIIEDHTYPSPTIHQAAANARVQGLSVNEQLATLETVDEDAVWADFREGDVISCNLANSGVSGKMLVRMRALDTTRGVMLVSGEAELA